MGNCGIKMAGVFLLALVCSGIACQAQLLPPDPFQELDSWSFEDTNFLSDLGDAPISMTNTADSHGHWIYTMTNNPVIPGRYYRVEAP